VPRLKLFARVETKGWDVFGKQVEKEDKIKIFITFIKNLNHNHEQI
jgi:hypothetical protein